MSWRIPAAAGLTLLLASCSPSTADRDAMPASRSPATAGAPPAEAAEEGVPADPPGPDDLVARAEIAGRGGDQEKAIRLLEQALKADPKHRKALFRLALAGNERASEVSRPESSRYYLQTAE